MGLVDHLEADDVTVFEDRLKEEWSGEEESSKE
jgi:hypothetical protein